MLKVLDFRLYPVVSGEPARILEGVIVSTLFQAAPPSSMNWWTIRLPSLMSSFHQHLLNPSSVQALLEACRHLDRWLESYVRGHTPKNEHVCTFCWWYLDAESKGSVLAGVQAWYESVTHTLLYNTLEEFGRKTQTFYWSNSLGLFKCLFIWRVSTDNSYLILVPVVYY